MAESATAPAVLAQSQLGMLVLGSDGGPIVLLPPTGAGQSSPAEEVGLSNPTEIDGDSNPT